MAQRRHPIVYLLALTLLNGCVVARGFNLPRYETKDIARGEPHRYTYEARVTGPLQRRYPRTTPDRGIELGALSEAIDSISKEIGVEMAQAGSAPPDIRFSLYLFPDPPAGLLGQYYEYFAGLTLFLLPQHDKVNYLLVAEARDNNGKWKEYRYEEAVHEWIDLALLPFALFSTFHEREKAIRDLALNFFHDLQNERAVRAEK